jgi:short-subunit dehydrogenase
VPPSIPALVTGASSGLGAEFARRLAARGHDITIVARRVDRLEALRTEILAKHPVTVDVLSADLETQGGRKAVASLLRRRSPWVLVNNAGFATRGALANLDAARERAEVEVNILAVQQLTAAVLPGLLASGAGGVINLASTASFQPIPYMATYAATKAFVLHFTEAVAEEVRKSGVRVMALCPGPVRTEFDSIAGTQDYMRLAAPMTMDADRCVAIALRAFDRGSTVCVPGILNATFAQWPRITPRFVMRRATGTVLGQRQ